MPKLLLLLMGLISNCVIGQVSDSTQSKVAGIKISYTFNRANQIEIGYGIGKFYNMGWDDIGVGGYRGGSFSLGYIFSNSKSLFVTKTTYEFMGIPFTGRVSLVNYTNFKQSQIIVLPEFGLSAMLFSVTYGYGFSLSSNKFEISPHTISILFVPYWKFRK